MFLLKDYFFGTKASSKKNTINDADDVGEHYSGDDNEFYNEETEMPFFDELERLYNFKNGELSTFYNNVMDAYSPELLSIGNAPVRRVKNFMHRYLSYLLPPPDPYSKNHVINIDNGLSFNNNTNDESGNAPFPWLVYEADNSTHVKCIDGEECSTFLVDSKLDYVYAYVMEKAIIDLLGMQCDQLALLVSETEDINASLDYLEDSLKLYRARSKLKYNYCADDGSDHAQIPMSRYCSNAYVIYTKKSSPFMVSCYNLIINQELITFSDDTLKVESVPFQQVLLLCGRTPSFITKHCQTDHVNRTVVVSSNTDLHDWVSVPIWFYLFYTHNNGNKQEIEEI